MIVTRRCLITQNLCGTDTWKDNIPCVCSECQLWLKENQKELDKESEQLLRDMVSKGDYL